MNKIIYYVATSLDGFISGPDGDINGFTPGGNGVEQYLEDLSAFDSVIMGRHTYELGYAYGLEPGQPAYTHMDHYIFSNNLSFDDPNEKVHIKDINLETVKEIRNQSKTDVYLCGGGVFAGWLLENEMIDILKLKINPLILGQGIRLFGDSIKSFQLELAASNQYDDGLLINSYNIKY